MKKIQIPSKQYRCLQRSADYQSTCWDLLSYYFVDVWTNDCLTCFAKDSSSCTEDRLVRSGFLILGDNVQSNWYTLTVSCSTKQRALYNFLLVLLAWLGHGWKLCWCLCVCRSWRESLLYNSKCLLPGRGMLACLYVCQSFFFCDHDVLESR